VEAPPTSVTPDPYTPPTRVEAAEELTQTGGWPGARRRSFYLMIFIFPIVWNLGYGFASSFFQTLPQETLQMIGLGVLVVPVLVSFYYCLQRLANVGMSRWWFLGQLVPILNIWVSYRMYVCPAGYAYHKKLDTAGIILAILFWLLLLIMLLAVAAIAAVFMGVAGDPEIQQKLNEMLQEALKQQSAGS
jgi:hypothetical protein